MTEPASKDDLEEAKNHIVGKLDDLGTKLVVSLEGMRAQNSAEHGSIYDLVQICAAGINWIKAAWRNFMILPPPPDKETPDKLAAGKQSAGKPSPAAGPAGPASGSAAGPVAGTGSALPPRDDT